jgi:hypothetical protein
METYMLFVVVSLFTKPSETAGKSWKNQLIIVSSTVNFAAATHPSNLDIESNDIYYTVVQIFLN